MHDLLDALDNDIDASTDTVVFHRTVRDIHERVRQAKTANQTDWIVFDLTAHPLPDEVICRIFAFESATDKCLNVRVLSSTRVTTLPQMN